MCDSNKRGILLNEFLHSKSIDHVVYPLTRYLREESGIWYLCCIEKQYDKDATKYFSDIYSKNKEFNIINMLVQMLEGPLSM